MTIIIIKVFVKRKIVSLETILSAYARAHTHPYTQAFQLYKVKFTTDSKRRLEMDEDSSTDQKTWQVYNFVKRNIFRLHLNESREGFCRRGRGRSFHVDGLKT